MNNSAIVNVDRVESVALILSKLKLNPSFYNRQFLNLKKDKESLLRMYFFSVAICHQTHKLHSEEKNIWGWDYLEYGFIEMLKNNSPLLQPQYIANTDKSILKNQLAVYFSEDKNPQTTTLDNLDERVDLMVDAARIISCQYHGNLSSLFDYSRTYLKKDNHGIYDVLKKFEAYSDPQKKKSTFLIKLLKEAGLIKIIDPENFIPIMDYHMQRVLLRTGCVEVTGDKLREKLINKEVLTSDEPIRTKCIEALRLIAEQSNHEITKMNDFFWSLGRSCCNETTLCHDKECSKVPCTFKIMVILEDHSECIFQEICPAATDDKYLKLWQPVVHTHYY